MILLSSELEASHQSFIETRDILTQHTFALGGNWDYAAGSFDRPLDEAYKVWLRIPFEVTDGAIDNSSSDTDATIKLGTPYVLKHLYKEGNDEEASVRLVGALFDQFQAPTDPDADIESEWVERAKDIMQQVERALS
ncbi:YugN family protein [Paenibacillus algorifonticola]|uniref:YugN family protein n=1 Tax=Paenibacillus algorifonticola TaxID=684063 RepID=UPI003D2A21A4